MAVLAELAEGAGAERRRCSSSPTRRSAPRPRGRSCSSWPGRHRCVLVARALPRRRRQDRAQGRRGPPAAFSRPRRARGPRARARAPRRWRSSRAACCSCESLADPARETTVAADRGAERRQDQRRAGERGALRGRAASGRVDEGAARRSRRSAATGRPTRGWSCEVEGGFDRPPLEPTPDSLALYERARAVAAELGFELGAARVGGASDGNLTAAAGIPTLDGLGPRGGSAHARDEFVSLSDLPRRAALLAALVAGRVSRLVLRELSGARRNSPRRRTSRGRSGASRTGSCRPPSTSRSPATSAE